MSSASLFEVLIFQGVPGQTWSSSLARWEPSSLTQQPSWTVGCRVNVLGRPFREEHLSSLLKIADSTDVCIFSCKGIVLQVFGGQRSPLLGATPVFVLSWYFQPWLPFSPDTPLITLFFFKQMTSVHQAFMHTILKWIAIDLAWRPRWDLPEILLPCLFLWPVPRQLFPFNPAQGSCLNSVSL